MFRLLGYWLWVVRQPRARVALEPKTPAPTLRHHLHRLGMQVSSRLDHLAIQLSWVVLINLQVYYFFDILFGHLKLKLRTIFRFQKALRRQLLNNYLSHLATTSFFSWRKIEFNPSINRVSWCFFLQTNDANCFFVLINFLVRRIEFAKMQLALNIVSPLYAALLFFIP